ncbi:MAG: pyridoxal phosphate-dependent aminotransferase [Candidatus Omnitrophota bacterium]
MHIDTRLAKRLKNVRPSSTLAITAKAKKLKAQGQDIVNLAAGEPDFDTPDFVKTAAIEAIKSGFTKYTPTTGIPELKQLISAKFKKDNYLEYEPEQIIASCGAKHSIFNALLALVDPQDEVLIPVPYWVSYPEMVNLCDGSIRYIQTQAGNGFKVSARDLKKAASVKSKVLILNSPSNPAGSVYTKEELQDIAAVCLENDIFIISDEIYEKLIYDGLRHVSIASLNKDIYNLAVTVNGFSKSFSMTGWRLGYLGAPADVAEAISRLQDHSTSNPNSITQKAAIAALKAPEDFYMANCVQFQERRDYCIGRIRAMPKITAVVPKGAFYIFCDISGTKLKSAEVANRLLEEKYLSIIPGGGFGEDNYIRISFAASLDNLEKGMDRLGEWLKNIS